MSSNVTDFPKREKGPDLFVGPFEYNKVVVDGRAVPNLTGGKRADGTCWLMVDDRFGADFPSEEVAHQAAWLIAQGMAIGAGYPHLGATSKDMPFAPICSAIGPIDP